MKKTIAAILLFTLLASGPAFAQNATNDCTGKIDRETCAANSYCCKSQCIADTTACAAEFFGFGTYKMQAGDKATMAGYEYALKDLALFNYALVTAKQTGSATIEEKRLEIGKEYEFHAAKITVSSTGRDSKQKALAEITFIPNPAATPSATPKPSAMPTPSATPAPTVQPTSAPTPKPPYYIPAAAQECDTFSICGGNYPPDCVEKGASIVAYSCKENTQGKKYKCRQNWQSDWNLLLCPACPDGFSFGQCETSGSFGEQRKTTCYKDYNSECSTLGCGSDETISEITSCTYLASGLKYCCRTNSGKPTPTPIPTMQPTPEPIEGQNQAIQPTANPTTTPTPKPARQNKTILDDAKQAILGPPPLVNITRFVNFPLGIKIPLSQGQALPVIETTDNGAFVEVTSRFRLDEQMHCSGPSDCECTILSKTSETKFNYQCVFHPPVNGTYELIARDINGNDNQEYVHQAILIPGESAALHQELEKQKVDLLILLAYAILAILLAAIANWAYKRIAARFLRLQKLNKKKERLEQEMRMLKYRLMRREISDTSYQKLLENIQAEYDKVRIDIADEIDKQAKRKKIV